MKKIIYKVYKLTKNITFCQYVIKVKNIHTKQSNKWNNQNSKDKNIT